MTGVPQKCYNVPSISILPDTIIATILSLVESSADRNRVSQVCRSFRFYERQSRRSLAVRGFQSHLGLVPLCFASVTDLDLSALTLLPSEASSFHYDERHQERLAKAFPKIRTLKVMTMNDDSARAIGHVWPQIENLTFTRQSEAQTPAHLKTILETFKRLEILDARNLQCGKLATAVAGRRSLALKSLNFETYVVTSDDDLELLAKKCTRLENLSIAVHPGRLKGEGFMDLANSCKNLIKLRVFLYLDSVRHLNAEDPSKSLQFLARMTSKLPNMEVHMSCQHIPSVVTGYRMERLMGMRFSICSLVLYNTDAELKGISSCSNLMELTLGACDSLGDTELLAVSKSCPKLVTLRIFNCKNVTQDGLEYMAKVAKLSSLSLCFLEIPVKAQVNAVKPLARSLCALRLMVNGPVDSLSSLSGWSQLTRIELTLTSEIPEKVLLQPWLESCPCLQHLGLVIQSWCPSTLRFLSMIPSLQSLSISFLDNVKRVVLFSFLEDIALLPQLSTLSLFICTKEWLSGGAGKIISRCLQLKSLNIFWVGKALILADRQFSLRPFLLKLLRMNCLQDVRLPPCLADEDDLKIFYRGLHTHTMQSILRSVSDLKAKDGGWRRPWRGGLAL